MTATRLNYFRFLSSEMDYLNQIDSCIAQSSLDPRLTELVKLRVSQINGCSFCVRYHTQRLRQLEETTERIDLVVTWQESPCITTDEKVALAWAEAVTRIPDTRHIDDELYRKTVQAFGEEATAQLTMSIALINTWNRLAVPFQTDHKHIADLLDASRP